MELLGTLSSVPRTGKLRISLQMGRTLTLERIMDKLSKQSAPKTERKNHEKTYRNHTYRMRIHNQRIGGNTAL